MAKVLINAVTSGIGNAVMLTPLIELACKQAGEPVDLLVKETASSQVFTGNPFIERLIYFKKSEIPQLLLSLRKRYKLILSPDGSAINFFLKGLGAQELRTISPLKLNNHRSYLIDFSWLGDSVYSVHDDEHESLSNARVLNPSFRFGQLPRPKIYLSQEERSWAKELMRSFDGPAAAAVQLGSSEQAWKRFPLERYQGILKTVLESNPKLYLLLLGNTQEEELMKAFKVSSGNPRIYQMKTSIREAFALLEQVRIFLGNDSGLGHAAAALGTRSLILFGPTNEKRSSPIGPVKLISEAVPCRPCYNRTSSFYRPDCCPFSYRCFSEISDGRILSEIQNEFTYEDKIQ